MDINEKQQYHYRIIGMIELFSAAIVISMGIWFFTDYFRHNVKSYDPNSDEKIIDINYGYEDSSYLFIPLFVISFITYVVGGTIFLSSHGPGKITHNYSALTWSTSLITGVIGLALLISGTISIQDYNKVHKTYTESDKQTAADKLKSEKVPYKTNGITSLVSGIVQILMMILIIVYYYKVVPREPRSYSADDSIPYASKNYLQSEQEIL